MRKIFIAMLLVVGMTANAQNTKDSTEIEPKFEEIPGQHTIVTRYVIPFEKVVYSSIVKGNSPKEKEAKNASVIAFNPHTLKMHIIGPNDSIKIKEAIQTYLGDMSSLKNKYFDGCGDNEIRFRTLESAAKIDSVITAFKDEAWQNLYKMGYKRLKSYNPYTDNAIIETFVNMASDITDGLNVWILNNYIRKTTNGDFSNVDDFQEALKARNEKAVKYAKKMK